MVSEKLYLLFVVIVNTIATKPIDFCPSIICPYKDFFSFVFIHRMIILGRIIGGLGAG